jgi:hypothetical protein
MGKLRTEMLPRLLSRTQQSGVRVGRVVAVAADGRPLVDYPGNAFGPLPARVTASVKAAAVKRALENGLEVLLAIGSGGTDGPILFDVVRARQRRSTSKERRIAPVAPESSPRTLANAGGACLGRIVAVQDGIVGVDFVGNPAGPVAARTTVPLRNLKDPVLLQLLPGGEPVIVGQIFEGAPVEVSGAAEADVVLKGRRVRIEAETELLLVTGQSKIHLDAHGKVVTTADKVVSRARGANKVQGGSVQLN